MKQKPLALDGQGHLSGRTREKGALVLLGCRVSGPSKGAGLLSYRP